jgi:hypothetical protein
LPLLFRRELPNSHLLMSRNCSINQVAIIPIRKILIRITMAAATVIRKLIIHSEENHQD